MNLLETIGETPLIALPSFSAELSGVTLLAKAEFMNPSGSVKDRAAKAMVLDGIARGLLTPDKTIIDATSGNTGIAYAMIGAALGYHVRLYLPQNTSPERKKIIRQYGATIVETGKEIWEQSGKQVTHFVAGMGTSGSFVGTARRLKFEDPRVKTLAVQPASPFHGIEGTKHMGSSIKPGILDETLFDDVISVTTEEAYASARRLARRDGIFVGISSGANVAAAARLARTLPAGSVVVTLLCDVGSRYLTDRFWNETHD